MAPTGLVYRDAALMRPQRELVDELVEALVTSNLEALLASAALETALADVGDQLATEAALVTDAIARSSILYLEALVRRLESWRSERLLRVSAPEGFAYYALSPRTYAEAARSAMSKHDSVIVIGIRTIGTALSAVSRAAIGARRATRFTVRPTGHPYARVAAFDDESRAAIANERHSAAFLVCDEGPGKSGSSFLAVAEALVALGVPASSITLLGTRPLELSSLVANDAAARFERFRYCSASGAPGHTSAQDLSHGRWHELLRRGLPPVPVWPSSERQKRLSPDGRSLHKFAGLGVHGRRIQERAEALAAMGFSPAVSGALDGDGFLAHRFVMGRSGSVGPAHLGRYIAARAELKLPPHDGKALQHALSEMMSVNVELEFGSSPLPQLNFERMVVPDARLMPHEWVTSESGQVLKTDATDHGDDHFFPGPCDPAWDLAGAIVEWRLDGSAREALLSSYREASGDDPRSRLAGFLVAYSAFQARYCVMAEHGCPPELAARWRVAHSAYRSALQSALPVRA